MLQPDRLRWLRVMTIVGIVGLGLAANLTAPERVATFDPNLDSPPLAVYLEPHDVPEASRPEHTALRGAAPEHMVIIVSTVEELVAQVERWQPASVWVHGAALPDVPASWLRTLYRNGIVIVGIDLTSRELAHALGADPTATPDWKPDGVVTFVLMAVFPNGYSTANDVLDLAALVARIAEMTEAP